MKVKIVIAALMLAVLAGCEDGEGLVAVTGPTGDNGATVSGRWTGQIHATVNPFPLVPGELLLTQSGTGVTGTLTINGSRTANVTGNLSGSRITGGWIYTDLCGGNASFTADLQQNATRMTGSYSSSDCLGVAAGSFAFERQP
jgi:hypothetical protein